MDEHISALQCTQCSYLTRNLNVLFSHCMMSHPGEPVEVRLYQCPFCEIKCSIVNFLEEHIETVHATGYNVTVNEVTRFIFNSGHHFIHRFNFNNHPSTMTTPVPPGPVPLATPTHLPLTQNWSTYSSSNFAQQQPTNSKREFNWKVPELNSTYADVSSPVPAMRQSTNSKAKRVVKTAGCWYPPLPSLSLNHQAQHEQTQQPALSIQQQPPLTPAPNTHSTYQVAPNSVHSSGIFSCASMPSTNSTISDTVAALITPRHPRPAPSNAAIQHLMLPSHQALLNGAAAEFNNNTVSAQNHVSQYHAAQVYSNRLANLAQRLMIPEDTNSHQQILQERLQNIMKRQTPLILRQQGENNQHMYAHLPSLNGPGTSSEVDKMLNNDTSIQQHLPSPASPSTQSSTQEDVIKSSQLSNGSTSSVGLTMSQSPDAPSNSIITCETVESGGEKLGDKVVRIQCNKCPESFDNAKALFCHRHFHHEGIVTKGRKLSQLSCYSQNNFINSDRRKYSINSNANSNNVKKHHETVSKEEGDNEEDIDVIKENGDVDGMKQIKSHRELAIDLTLNNDSNEVDTTPSAHVNDVNRKQIHAHPSSSATNAVTSVASTGESNSGPIQMQPAVSNDPESNICVDCGIRFIDMDALQDHFKRSRRHKTYIPRQSVRKTRQKQSDENSNKAVPLNFGSVTRLRLVTSPKSLRLRNKDNMKSQTTAIPSESASFESSSVYSCPHCNTTMSSPCQLLCHCWQMHKIRPLRCSYCHQYFVSSKENTDSAKTQLSNHLLARHGALHNDEQQQQVQIAPIRPSQCYYCNRVFANKPAVKQHMREEHAAYNPKKPRYSDELENDGNEVSME